MHAGIVAVHKPAGVPVHPAGAGGPEALTVWLAEQPELPAGTTPIHRLDQGASGLVLCAADPGRRAEVAGWLARGAEEGLDDLWRRLWDIPPRSGPNQEAKKSRAFSAA